MLWFCACVQYNRMLENQEAARQKATAVIKARLDAIGDIATRDKEAALVRQKAEERRLIEEAEKSKRRAKMMEEREAQEVLHGVVLCCCDLSVANAAAVAGVYCC